MGIYSVSKTSFFIIDNVFYWEIHPGELSDDILSKFIFAKDVINISIVTSSSLPTDHWVLQYVDKFRLLKP